MDDGEIRSGNVGAVERRGGTVRRPVGRWTPAVHALLRHLEHAGFAAAPRVVCVEADVEVLTYIEGEVPGDPWPVALRTDATLTETGRVLRAFHDAVATFAPPRGSEWRLGTVPLVDDDVVRHGDVGPWNTVWRRAGFTHPPDRRHRLAVLCDAYGADPLAVVDAAQRVRRTETEQLRDLGGRGVEPYATFLARGAVEAMRLSDEWLERHRDQLI